MKARDLMASAMMALSADALANEHEVVANPGFSFFPAVLTVRPGDIVNFRNVGGRHNVVADDGSFRCAVGCDGEGGSGDASVELWSFSRRFDMPGTVPY